MTRPCCKHRHGQPDVPTAGASLPASPPAAPSHSEPVMRRWPHPVEPPAPPEADVRKLLQRQTELLLEVRALLVSLTAEQSRRE